MDFDLTSMHFDSMLHCESRGDYRTMRKHLKAGGMQVAETADLATLREFSKLLLRVIDAIDVEAEQGLGSLLDRSHPANIKWPTIKGSTPELSIWLGET